MFEIHTPKSWRSTFPYPCIIVDDEGLIYNSADYHKLLRNPIGKIDYKSGYIYGEDYCKLLPSPIGSFKKDGDVTMIFGEDYTALNPTPILYIKGNEVYSAEEYHKLLSTPSYYIKADSAQNSKGAARLVMNGKREDGETNKFLKKVLAVFAAVFIGVALIFATVEDITYLPVFVVALFVGFVLTFLVSRTDDVDNALGSIFVNALCAELATTVVFWIGIMIIDLPGSEGFSVFATIFVTPILIALMMAVPSLVIGLIVYGIRKLIKH